MASDSASELLAQLGPPSDDQLRLARAVFKALTDVQRRAVIAVVVCGRRLWRCGMSSDEESGSVVTEATMPLTINGVPAAQFIKRAYDLGADLNGPGRYDMSDPVQAALRNVKGWIEMAERDALQARSE